MGNPIWSRFDRGGLIHGGRQDQGLTSTIFCNTFKNISFTNLTSNFLDWQVSVQMMNNEKRFQIYHDQMLNTSVLHLPFNSSHSMLLLLPEDMAKLENAISPGHVTKWLKWMKFRFGKWRINHKPLIVDVESITLPLCMSPYLFPRKYKVYIPKFSIKTSYSLKNVLTEMGMADMFNDRADLSGIAEEQDLVVSDVRMWNINNVNNEHIFRHCSYAWYFLQVVHQATLDVDEAGATAAAATGAIITLYSFQYVPVLKFNRPFMVIITDHSTDNILFVGRITNPKSWCTKCLLYAIRIASHIKKPLK